MNKSDGIGPGGGSGIGRIAAITVVILLIVGMAWLIVMLSDFLMLVFAALVLAAIFGTIAHHVERHLKIARGWSLLLSVLTVFAVFGGTFYLFGTQLAGQFDTIRASIPPAVDQLRLFVDRMGLSETVQGMIDESSENLSRYVGQAGIYVISAGNGIANLLLVIVGAIFLAANPDVYRRGLLLLMPRRAEPVVATAIDDASRGLRGWMLGQAVSSLVVAAFSWAGLALLGVPASGGLGLIAGLLDVIPMIGPIIAAIPAVLLAFTVSPTVALWTVLLFVVVQQLQGNFLQPMIQKHAVDVPPAVLLFAVVAAGLVFGFIGVLLAAPLTVVVFVLVQRIYVRTLLDKPIRIAGED